MTEIRTARQIAEHIIRDAATDIESGDIVFYTEVDVKALGEEAYDQLRREVDDLISTATVTITFRDAPDA